MAVFRHSANPIHFLLPQHIGTMPNQKVLQRWWATVAENLNAISGSADIVVAHDRLQSIASTVESVSMVVAWFGDDLLAGSCKVRPGVELAAKTTTP